MQPDAPAVQPTRPAQPRTANVPVATFRERRVGRLRRAIRSPRRLLALPISLALVLLSRILRPFVLIRFHRLWTSRIGHLALEPEYYLCERELGLHPPRTLDLFGVHGFVANEQLLKMLRRQLRILPLVDEAVWLNHKIPGHQAHTIPWPGTTIVPDLLDAEGILQRASVHFEFTPKELARGQTELRRLGVPDGARHVCFTCRDSAYLRATMPDLDASYHDYRDASIESYLPAAEELASRGYYALRTGAIVGEPLSRTSERVIDYSTIGRTDFMDIYLPATAAFLLFTSSGPASIGWAMRRPMALANFAPLDPPNPLGQGNIFIPKLYWSAENRRFLRFSEIRQAGAHRFLRTEKFMQLGIELVENTPDEIRDLAVEMDERLRGRWTPRPETEELQRRYWRSAGIHDLDSVSTRVGEGFLVSHSDLLDE